MEKWGSWQVDGARTERMSEKAPFQTCSTLLLRNIYYPFLDRIVNCDGIGSFDNRKRPDQWLDRYEAPKLFPTPKMRSKKTMVTTWWCSTRAIHYGSMNPSKTNTTEKHWRNSNFLPLHYLSEAGRFFYTMPGHTLQRWRWQLNKLGYEILRIYSIRSLFC